jgi:hypothetical protein
VKAAHRPTAGNAPRVPACLAFALAFAAPAAPVAPAARAAEAPPPRYSLELGLEERVRTENWDNVADFDADALASGDARHQWRFRTRLWQRLRWRDRAEFFVQLNNESCRITTPATRFAWDETVIENLYLDLRSGSGSVRVGRQDIRRGDGFVLGDGGPLDGSRTAYVNAALLGATLGHSRLELMAVSDPDRDIYLPPIRVQRRAMIERDERAGGVYLTRQGGAAAGLEAYYFFKTETGDTRAATNPLRQPDRRFHTLGARHAGQRPDGWSWTAELAVQAGRQDPDADVRAWGTAAFVRRTVALPGRPALGAGFVGLSGDDASTADIEGWNPLFSRWPQFSELYIYSLAAETGPSYWTNLRMWRAELSAAPDPRLQLKATYSLLGAYHPFPGRPPVFAGGATRGHLVGARADVKLGEQLRGHVIGEWLEPGSFYTGIDPAWFFRVELLYTLRHRSGG